VSPGGIGWPEASTVMGEFDRHLSSRDRDDECMQVGVGLRFVVPVGVVIVVDGYVAGENVASDSSSHGGVRKRRFP